MTGMTAHGKKESWLTLTGQVDHLGADYSVYTNRRSLHIVSQYKHLLNSIRRKIWSKLVL